ncbi:hypothetical protein [Lawsonella clevelandensis]|uniref:hypothetical protein n=1 Tax=Lawsonella clevelandensis TaxID=1528099 RepID=UPI0032D95CFA
MRDDVVGSEEPRLFPAPLRELTPETSLGFECCDFLENICGWSLLPWQRWLYIHALELLPGGNRYRFQTLVILVARQNGKTKWLIGLALWRLFMDGAIGVTSTAHTLEYAENTLAEGVDEIEAVPALRRELRQYMRTNGKRKVFLNPVKPGSSVKEEREERVWDVQSANRGGGRSLTRDLVIIDELRQHQSFEAYDAITPATTARPRGQIVCTSNAGDKYSVVLRQLRKQGIDAINTNDRESSLALFEWSVPDAADPADESLWGLANPSLGHTIELRTLRGSFSSSTVEGFKTEHLCQWVEAVEHGVFPEGAWERSLDDGCEPSPGARVAVGCDMSYDRSKLYVAVAYETEDGKIGVEVVAQRAGSRWLPQWLLSPERGWFPGQIALQGRGAPVSVVADDLQECGIDVVPWQSSELSKGCSLFYDLVAAGEVKHRSQPVLDAAASVARVKPVGDAWVWDRKNTPVDVAPLVAANAAVWLLGRPKPEVFISAYEDSGVVMC